MSSPTNMAGTGCKRLSIVPDVLADIADQIYTPVAQKWFIISTSALTNPIRSPNKARFHSDPLTYLAISVLFLLVALAASYIPARRAMRVDPVIALRYD